MATPLVFLLVCLVGTALSGPSKEVKFHGSQVLRVTADTKGLANDLVHKEGLDVWSGGPDHLDVLVPAGKVASVKKTLRSNGITFRTMIPDLQTAINQENPPVKIAQRNRAGYRMNWQQYQTLDVIYEFLDTLARQNPSFVSVGSIGSTYERRPIKYIKISSGRPNAKAVFIDGGIHAREWVSPAAMTYIIQQLVENRGSVPPALREIDIYIVPVLNPDGYVYTHTRDRMWRKNRSRGSGWGCEGTDLNRNFDFAFGGKGTSGNSCDETYRGSSPASEPETKALQGFLASIRNLKGYVTFHAYSQLIMLPYGDDYNNRAPNHNQLMEIGNRAAQAIRNAGGPVYRVGNIAEIIYPAAGGSIDFARGKLNVPIAFAFELRDTGYYGFVLPAHLIIPTSIDAWEAIKVIASAAARA